MKIENTALEKPIINFLKTGHILSNITETSMIFLHLFFIHLMGNVYSVIDLELTLPPKVRATRPVPFTFAVATCVTKK